jgi:DNA-binding transcriptional MerR regulator
MDMERPQDGELLSIGRFARESGLSHKALRLYAELGLLVPAHTDRFTGYRYYGREQLRLAVLIRLMREMEMALRDIRLVLVASPPEAERLIAEHQRAFAGRLEQARKAGRQLISTMRQEEITMTMQVEERSLAPQQVVSVTGHTQVSGLDEFIRRSLERLAAFVAEQGGRVDGPPLGIFHGQINHEDDGPIEVCLPAEGAFQARGDVSIRELPGGPAAVVTVRDEYTDFPKIIEGYDAGYDWIVSHGHRHVESPREVWVGSVASGGPFEIVWRFE